MTIPFIFKGLHCIYDPVRRTITSHQGATMQLEQASVEMRMAALSAALVVKHSRDKKEPLL